MLILILLSYGCAITPNIRIFIGPISPSLSSADNSSYMAFDENLVRVGFDIDDYPILSCVPIDLYTYKTSTLDPIGGNNQEFQLPLQIRNLDNKTLKLIHVNVTDYWTYQNIRTLPKTNEFYIYQYQQLELDLIHFCSADSNKYNYWSVKSLYLKFEGYDPISIQYQFMCNPDYHPQRFDWTYIILVAFMSLVIWKLAQFGKIYSIKVIFKGKGSNIESQYQPSGKQQAPFQGLHLGLWQAVIYIGLIVGSMFLSLSYEEKAEKPMMILVYILSALCCFMFADEIFCIFLQRVQFFKKKFVFLRVTEYLAFAITVILMTLYLTLNKPFFLSDLITICILGTFVKLFKITSVKQSLQFFLPIMIVDILCSIYLGLTVRYEWDSVIMKYFNTPLLAQILFINNTYKKKCGWVSIFNIMFPGFFLGYVHRYDKSKQTLVYQIISFLGLIVGLVLWVVVQYLISFPLPTSIFTEILMISVTILVSYARNELNVFWSGLFYDELLLNPFKGETDPIPVIDLFGAESVMPSQFPLQKLDDRNEIENGNGMVKEKDGEIELGTILFKGLQPSAQASQRQDQNLNTPIGAKQIVSHYPVSNQPLSNLPYVNQNARQNVVSTNIVNSVETNPYQPQNHQRAPPNVYPPQFRQPYDNLNQYRPGDQGYPPSHNRAN